MEVLDRDQIINRMINFYVHKKTDEMTCGGIIDVDISFDFEAMYNEASLFLSSYYDPKQNK